MKRIILLVLTGIGTYISAQEKLGIVNSNYSSSNSIYLNPSSSVDSKTYMQLNLAGANFSLFNNIGYLPWFSVWRMKRHGGEIQYPKISSLKLKKFLYATAGIDGPAFVISHGNIGAGLFVRARSVVDVQRLPYELTNALLQDNPYDNFPKQGDLNIRNIKFSNMSWLEYGLNFGMMLKSEKKDVIILGGNLKYNTGINIFYANLQKLKGSYNDTMLNLEELTGKLRYNQPAFNTGRGYGADFGITYKRMLKTVDRYYPHTKKSNCTTVDYKFKAALSLRDLGYIKFTRNTVKSELSASGYINASRDTTQSMIESNLNITTAAGNIWATLPTNLSAQFDWNFENHIYLNGTVVKNLVPNALTGVQSPNLLSVCPRVEFKNWEVALPFTLQKFMYPQLGLAFRVRSFVLGFDNVIPLIAMKPRTYGLGVYFNLGISLFKNPACRKSQRIVDCPPNTMTKTKSGKNKRWMFWKKKR
ncbi:MAG: hypothetical protein IT236_00085 [Bacteroidia bacterium]|nr:hypothetical protein [Bacteroidia bacterium]